MNATNRTELTLERFLPYVMNRLAETISAELSTIYTDEYGLSIAQWRVIANLAEHKTLKAQQIVKFTDMEKSMISRAVSALDKRGLLAGELAEGDNRAKNLSLTKAGLALYQSIVPNVLNWEAELLSGLSETECRSLMTLLDKLRLKLEGADE